VPSNEPIEMLDEVTIPEPGTKIRGMLRFSHSMLEGWSWPIVIVRGAQDGPRLTITSGVHPTEYPAIEGNIRTASALDPATLKGTVVSLPILDMPAFYSRSPFVCPIDGKNPNRFFPGDPDGSFTQVMDDAIFKSVIAPSDAFIDLHGGDMVEDLEPFTMYSTVGTDAVNAKSAELAGAFGIKYVIASSPRPGAIGGTTVQAAATAGIPSILPEAGGCGLLTEPETQIMVDGIANVMRHLGMLDGAVTAYPEPTLITQFTWLYAPVEGVWYPSVKTGATVNANQVVGKICSLFGDQLAEITSPHAGIVLFVTSSPAMKEEGILLAIGEL
jgi:predicted deacylase